MDVIVSLSYTSTGHYCEAENITTPTDTCTAGYYCVLGAITPTPDGLDDTGGPCPQGTWCEDGWSWPSNCPKGTYGHTDKLPSEASCTDCNPGQFCMVEGMTAPNGSCYAGEYLVYSTNHSEADIPFLFIK